jgi:hypothetical protein
MARYIITGIVPFRVTVEFETTEEHHNDDEDLVFSVAEDSITQAVYETIATGKAPGLGDDPLVLAYPDWSQPGAPATVTYCEQLAPQDYLIAEIHVMSEES